MEADRSLDGHKERHRAVLFRVRTAGVVWIDLDAVLRLPHLTQLGEWGFHPICLTPCFVDSWVDLLSDEGCGKHALSGYFIHIVNLRSVENPSTPLHVVV
jgi:hypothetical protein